MYAMAARVFPDPTAVETANALIVALLIRGP
jgi:hypothetical protein